MSLRCQNLGNLAYFLRMEIVNTNNELFLRQKKYVEDILNMSKMSSCNPANIFIKINIKLKKETEDEPVNNTLAH